MHEELRSAEEWIDGFFSDWDERIRRYHGPGWREDGGGSGGRRETEDYDPENFAYEWVAHYTSSLVLGNPRFRLSTTRSGPERVLVKAHELALNRWSRETNLRLLNEKLAVDFGLHRAICLVLPGDLDPLPGGAEYEDPVGWPSARRVSPKRYVYDVRAIEKEEELWRGYKSIHRKPDLEQRAREKPDEHWDLEAIDALLEEAEVEHYRPQGRGREGSSKRNEVVLYNIWMREYEPSAEDVRRYGRAAWGRGLRHGAWLTLGVVDNDRSSWVRHPFPYWGHRRGPFVIIDGYIIPDESCGLAPIPAVKEQSDELNLHARAISRAMALYKRGVLVDATDPEFGEKIKGFEDHWVVGIDGLEDIGKKVAQIEIAGATEQHFAHMEFCRQRVARNGGLTDVERGQTEAGVTATADQLASNAAQTKVGFLASKFVDGVREIAENVSVYLGYDKTRTRLGPEARRVLFNKNGQPIENAVYEGGLNTPQEEAWFNSLSITIEPYSMGQTSDALEQQRLLQLMNLLAVLLPMMGQYPFVMWDDLIETIGEMMNAQNMSDYFDPQALKQFQALVLQGQQVQATQGGLGKPQPRLSGDTSRMLQGAPAVPLNGNMLGALVGAARRTTMR